VFRKLNIQRIALIYLLALAFSIWGFVVGHYQIYPYPLIKSGLDELTAFFEGVPEDEKTVLQRLTLHPQERNRQYRGYGFEAIDKSFVDSGYLLLSFFSKESDQVVIDLIRLSDFKVLHTWIPPIDEILDDSWKGRGPNTKARYRAQHPFLLYDGSLLFTSGEGPLVKIDRNSNLKWIIDAQFHHSIERDHEGNFVVPIVNKPKIIDAYKGFRDDGFAVVSPEGKILRQYSIGKILLENQYRGLFFGTGKLQKDRIHLNDAQPILEDRGVAKKGDIALSIRHLSTVLLYRPGDNSIVWLKTGPWLYQHDVNLLEDGRYSIFGNDMYETLDGPRMRSSTISNIYIYDPEVGRIDTPYNKILERTRMVSDTEGRSRLLPNGDVFIEETDNHRLMRVSFDTTRWVYVNGLTEETSGKLHWTRYFNSEEIDLNWLVKIPTNN
jgi:hypothetical protein